MAKGLINAVMPKIKAILAILEPKTLPTAVSVLPLSAAAADTIISGAEEPIARMVMPITSGEMPTLRARAAAPKTSLSALHIKSIKPAIRNATAASMMIPDSRQRENLTFNFDALRVKRKAVHGINYSC